MAQKEPSKKPVLLKLVEDDGWLSPYSDLIQARYDRFKNTLSNIEKHAGSLEAFAHAYTHLGINYDPERKGWYYREWAPAANALYLIGDFNGWNRTSHPLKRREDGVWEIFLDEASHKNTFVHGSFFKVMVVNRTGSFDRIPAFVRRVVQEEQTIDFKAQLWMPDKPFQWTDQQFEPSKIGPAIIYESHVGLAIEEERVGTFREFADHILPRIKKLNYNTVQLMAIQEHPYYGSFGYHVSNFFAVSSRFGTPEDLKYLVNKAHRLGMAVIMDIVHSHAVKNFYEGLNEFDGTDYQYFHAGGKGYHEGWDSKLFNYGKWEVMQFLLSNVRFWLEEFHFDGFRFDGVTSMMYTHHGNTAFDHYDKYFRYDVDEEAVTYLQLANELIHRIKPNAISIAEDVSGMPGLCRPMHEGGVGFDYRLGMGLPDYWIKVLKHYRDEDWNIEEMWGVMTNRRYGEKTIAYAESHDQALVGDKSIAFWLMDKEMYWFMRKTDQSLVIDRGIALHKMIRLFTLSLGGDGYLNFIGNEFGHPEWLDFPREGNGWSYKYCRRQWSLVDNMDLRYEQLYQFDRDMIALVKKYKLAEKLNVDTLNKTIVFQRGKLIFVFNFHHAHAIPEYQFWVPNKGKYSLVLNSDNPMYGGFNRIDESVVFHTDENQMLRIYNTNRTVQVFRKV
jgi:1,4-alpha-glucan branching enzyme